MSAVVDIQRQLAPVTPLVKKLPADVAIETVFNVVTGLPAYIAGSAVAAETYSNVDIHAFDDVDVFLATETALIAASERLQWKGGFVLLDRSDRVYARWLDYGFQRWHTHSAKLELPGTDLKVNLVAKKVDNHPTTSLSQVIESFDFGLLAVGYDCQQDYRRRDFRSALFPDLDPDGPLPLMPNKRQKWISGFISDYNGLREVGRYAKYAGYGFDMTAVKDDLVKGYWSVSEYLLDKTDKPERVKLGQIYQSIAIHMEDDNIDQLAEAGKEILYEDDLDKIMASLE